MRRLITLNYSVIILIINQFLLPCLLSGQCWECSQVPEAGTALGTGRDSPGSPVSLPTPFATGLPCSCVVAAGNTVSQVLCWPRLTHLGEDVTLLLQHPLCRWVGRPSTPRKQWKAVATHACCLAGTCSTRHITLREGQCQQRWVPVTFSVYRYDAFACSARICSSAACSCLLTDNIVMGRSVRPWPPFYITQPFSVSSCHPQAGRHLSWCCSQHFKSWVF